MCKNGVLVYLAAVYVAPGTLLYNSCEVECWPGCSSMMQGDGVADAVCNVGACCYDEGDYYGTCVCGAG